MNKLYPIMQNALPNMMNFVYPKIEAACAYSVGKYKGTDIVQKLVSGHMQLWAAVDEEEEKLNGIAITEIAVYPQRKVCRFLCATGESASEWIELISGIEEWAKDMGCKSFQAECRPGWEKMLKNFDYKRTHVILSKELA